MKGLFAQAWFQGLLPLLAFLLSLGAAIAVAVAFVFDLRTEFYTEQHKTIDRILALETQLAGNTKGVNEDVLRMRLGVLDLIDLAQPTLDPDSVQNEPLEPADIRAAIALARCHTVRAWPYGVPVRCVAADQFRENQGRVAPPESDPQ